MNARRTSIRIRPPGFDAAQDRACARSRLQWRVADDFGGAAPARMATIDVQVAARLRNYTLGCEREAYRRPFPDSAPGRSRRGIASGRRRAPATPGSAGPGSAGRYSRSADAPNVPSISPSSRARRTASARLRTSSLENRPRR